MKFYPAKHNSLFIWVFQWLSFIGLSTKLKLNILPSDIKALSSMAINSGLILVANHSDELDPRVCMELSRRSGRRFTFMVNSEVYEEWWFGAAIYCLQHIGSFSVERGAFDQVSIRYAVDTVKQSKETLVMFPEGEIYNLNDEVQVFKPGVVHIGLDAVKETSREHLDWTVYILPVAIKYRYQKNIGSTLKKRIEKMEQHLSLRSNVLDIKEKLYVIMSKLGDKIAPSSTSETETKEINDLIDKLQRTRELVVEEIEKKYTDPTKIKGDLLSRAQKMIFFLREQISNSKLFTLETQQQFQEDLKALKHTIQIATWQPQYIELESSEDHLAETVIKLEKMVFDKKRSPPLGKREAFVRLLEPVDIGAWLDEYERDPSATAKKIAEELRTRIQKHIKLIADQ